MFVSLPRGMYVAMHFAAAAQVLLLIEFVVLSSQFLVTGRVPKKHSTVNYEL
jgi:hypothetical protein